jgi:hypothetical protein
MLCLSLLVISSSVVAVSSLSLTSLPRTPGQVRHNLALGSPYQVWSLYCVQRNLLESVQARMQLNEVVIRVRDKSGYAT